MFETMAAVAQQLVVRRARVAGLGEDGSVLVDVEGGAASLPCGFVTSDAKKPPAFQVGDQVLIALDSTELQGYILGLLNMKQTIVQESQPSGSVEEAGNRLEIGLPEKPRDITVNGKRIVIEAHDEIHLKCGKSSIIMDRDGKVIIRGTDLVSRSSGMNKIKGAAVGIN